MIWRMEVLVLNLFIQFYLVVLIRIQNVASALYILIDVNMETLFLSRLKKPVFFSIFLHIKSKCSFSSKSLTIMNYDLFNYHIIYSKWTISLHINCVLFWFNFNLSSTNLFILSISFFNSFITFLKRCTSTLSKNESIIRIQN